MDFLENFRIEMYWMCWGVKIKFVKDYIKWKFCFWNVKFMMVIFVSFIVCSVVWWFVGSVWLVFIISMGWRIWRICVKLGGRLLCRNGRLCGWWCFCIIIWIKMLLLKRIGYGKSMLLLRMRFDSMERS